MDKQSKADIKSPASKQVVKSEIGTGHLPPKIKAHVRSDIGGGHYPPRIAAHLR